MSFGLREVSVRRIAGAIGAGKDTVRRYGADLREHAESRVREAHVRAGRAKQGLRGRLEVVTAERDEWRERFEGAQRQLLAIQYHLHRSKEVDLDGVMRDGVPAPGRDRPATTERNHREGILRRER